MTIAELCRLCAPRGSVRRETWVGEWVRLRVEDGSLACARLVSPSALYLGDGREWGGFDRSARRAALRSREAPHRNS